MFILSMEATLSKIKMKSKLLTTAKRKSKLSRIRLVLPSQIVFIDFYQKSLHSNHLSYRDKTKL